MKQIGKVGKINLAANRKLKKIYSEMYPHGGFFCELGFPGCTLGMFLGFAHRHKRIWYRSNPDLLSSYNQTILACTNCHQKIEKDKDLTDRVFLDLRGSETC